MKRVTLLQVFRRSWCAFWCLGALVVNPRFSGQTISNIISNAFELRVPPASGPNLLEALRKDGRHFLCGNA
jgi:hypothetical protein